METVKQDFIIIHNISEFDILKFQKKLCDFYAAVNPDKIIYKAVNISNVPTQNGLLSVFNLYAEELTDETGFKAWQTALKYKINPIN